MKKLLLVVLGIALTSTLVFAQAVAPTAAVTPAATDITTITGTVIDNACAGAHGADIAEFVKTHPKSCALMPACVASGYSIFADGKLSKFDKASTAKIEEFLKKEDSKTMVVVTVKKVGEELSLVTIENQK